MATGNLTPALTQIGGGSYGDRYYDGFIGEVLVYDTVLTTTQRQQVEEYLSNKWLGTDYSLQLPTVAMTGTGTLNLSNTNTYTGSTSITGGKVIVTGNGATGPSSAAGVTVAGGTLGLAGGFDYTDAEPISFSGSGANGAGALENISGNNTFGVPFTGSGALTIGSAAGTLTVNALTSLLSTTPLTVVGAGTVDITSSVTLGAGTVTVTDNGTGVLNIDGNISLPGATTFTLAGNGTIAIGGNIALGALGSLADSTSGMDTINGVISGTNTSPPSGPTLPDIPGLEYDLDATDSASLVTNGSGGVTQWDDLSGNGYDFSTTGIPVSAGGQGTGIVASKAPQLVSNAINGLPALQFFGAANPTELVGAPNVNAQTVIMVTETNPFDSSESCCEGIFGYAGSDNSLRFDGESVQPARGAGGAGNGNDFNYGTPTIITTATGTTQTDTFPYSTPYIVVATTGNTGFTPPLTEIGGGSYGDRYYDGYIGQVLVYNTVLTTAQIQEVEEYLDAKWLTTTPTITGEVTMAGSGSLTLTNVNTYTGLTVVDAGSVVVTKNAALGPATAAGVVITGGSIGFAGNVDYTTGEPITISGSGYEGTGAIVNISGANTFTSNITLNGSATIGSDAGLLTLSGNINLGLGYTFTVTGTGNLTISGVVSGTDQAAGSLPGIAGLQYELDASDAASLVTNSSGVSQWDDISGNSHNFTAVAPTTPGEPTTVTEPALVQDAIGDLPALQFFGPSAPTELLGADGVNAQTVIIVTVTSSANQADWGIWGGANPGHNVDESLRLANNSEWASTINGTANSGDYNLANGADGTNYISTATSLDQNSGSFTDGMPYIEIATGNYTPTDTMIGGGSYGSRYYDGDIGEVLVYNTVLTTAQRQEVEQYLTDKWLLTPNNVVKTGTGTVTLTNTNTYSGTTTINGGTLTVTANGAMGAASDPGIVVNSGGALAFTGGVDYATAEPLSIAGAGPAGKGAIENLSGSNTFAGAITLAANATIGSDAGTLNLTGTAINMDNGSLTTVGAGNINIPGQLQFAGTPLPYGLTTDGTGTVTVSNADNTYPGATTVNAGTLLVNGKLVDTSGVAVNAGGTLAGTGSFTAAAVVAAAWSTRAVRWAPPVP